MKAHELKELLDRVGSQDIIICNQAGAEVRSLRIANALTGAKKLKFITSAPRPHDLQPLTPGQKLLEQLKDKVTCHEDSVNEVLRALRRGKFDASSIQLMIAAAFTLDEDEYEEEDEDDV